MVNFNCLAQFGPAADSMSTSAREHRLYVTLVAKRWITRQAGVLVLIGLLLSAAAAYLLPRRRTTSGAMATIAAAAERAMTRTVQPRLSASWPYKPFRRVTRAGSGEARPILPYAGTDNHARALAHILAGDSKHAIAMLRDLLRGPASELDDEGVTRADLFAEIASAEYQVALDEGDASAMAAAFEDSARALSAEPNHIAALHVRALSLEGLSLREDAMDAWREYLVRDSRSEWAAEGREHLRRLETASPGDPTNALLRAADADDAVTAQKLCHDRPEYARALVEETLLGTWGDALAHHDDPAARQALRRALMIGKALAASGRDQMPLDAASAAAHASATDASRFAAAQSAFAAARSAFQKASDAKARDSLERSARMLEALHSPLAGRAWIACATVSHYLGQTDSARAILSAVIVSLDGHEAAYPVAAGEALWMLGLTDQSQGLSAEALRHYAAARSWLERAGEVSHLAGISTVLSETYRYVGDLGQAWSCNLEALRWADAGGTYKRRQIVTNDAALLAIESRYPRFAERLSQRMLIRARNARDGVFEALALLTQGRALVSRGRVTEARAVLDDAASVLQRTRRDGSTLRLIADVAAVRAELTTPADPPAAVALLSTAFNELHDLHHRSRLARLHLVLARAQHARGDQTAEERELIAGLEELEGQRAHLDDDQERSTFTDTGRALYDDTVRLLVARHEDAAALNVVRRARTLGVTSPGALASDDMSGGASALPGAAFLEYYILDDETLLTWITANGRTQMIRSPAKHVREMVDHDAAAISRCIAANECTAETTRLYDLLIAPARSAIGSTDELLIAPDGVLHVVPFAALYDATTRRFLGEQHAITMVLSAEPSLSAGGSLNSILVAAAPAPAGMAELAGTAGEARAASRAFRRSMVLRDRDATATRFVSEVPQYDGVHFAGHAVWNEAHPRLAALRFASDARHSTGELHPGDLRTIDFSHTQLVVLAACDTARGRVTNAGALSFARAFAARGVPNVIGSLWPVDDAASESFFTTFYAAVAHGRSPAEALRAAQQDLITHSGTGPAAWGAFQLYTGNRKNAPGAT